MTGLEYEHKVADYLKRHGYTGVTVTRGSGDYGVDVIAHKYGSKYAVQCKYYTGSVGVSAVQEAVAGKAIYGCDQAMVVTNSRFTPAARKLAQANGVLLIDNLTAGLGGLRRPIRRSLWAVYILIILGCIGFTSEMAEAWPASDRPWLWITMGIFVTLPLWGRFLLRKLWRLLCKAFRRFFHTAASGKSVPQDRTDHSQPSSFFSTPK